MDAHEHIVQLDRMLVLEFFMEGLIDYLLIANCELALRLLVCLGKGLKLLNGLGLRDLHAEFHIRLGIFMAGLVKLALYITMWKTSNVQKSWCRRARMPESHSKPCAYARHFPRRIDHILGISVTMTKH